MSDTPVSETVVAEATTEAVVAPVKRRPSTILAELEARVDSLHLVKAVYADHIAAIRLIRTEYAAAQAEIAAVFTEVESVPEQITGWFESHF